ncbi:MAG TPA: family 1 glycosylhydrolase [Chthoniobacterales bacterium]|jgi:beta-glucosidase/6-phospho-beta-glucosidase/beta-galactosidase
MRTSKDFLWGVATSAYQAEGRYNRAGEPRTNWAAAEERGDVAVLGDSADFLRHYPEDFARCRRLGLSAFRLGIEWSRIQPKNANEFDAEALAIYAKLIAECQRAGLTPVVTLHHFVHPEWLGTDPWLESAIIPLFESYVSQALAFVNKHLLESGLAPIHFLITINEPNMLVLNSYLGRQFPTGTSSGFSKCLRAYDSLIAAHVRAYHAIHRLYHENQWPTPAVTVNNYCSDLYWSDKFLLDLLSIRERGVPDKELASYLHRKAGEFDEAFQRANIRLERNLAWLFGTLVKKVSNVVGRATFGKAEFPLSLQEITAGPSARTFDYIGLDYYDPFAAHAFRFPVWWDHEFKSKSFHEWIMASITSKWWDWRVLASGLNFFCTYYSKDLAGREVLIAENGMAIRRKWDNRESGRRDRITRSQFLELHVAEVRRICEQGVPLIGYLHWSLFDNYEWGSYTPRFGLYRIDFLTGTERQTSTPSGDNPSATYARLIAESQS